MPPRVGSRSRLRPRPPRLRGRLGRRPCCPTCLSRARCRVVRAERAVCSSAPPCSLSTKGSPQAGGAYAGGASGCLGAGQQSEDRRGSGVGRGGRGGRGARATCERRCERRCEHGTAKGCATRCTPQGAACGAGLGTGRGAACGAACGTCARTFGSNRASARCDTCCCCLACCSCCSRELSESGPSARTCKHLQPMRAVRVWEPRCGRAGTVRGSLTARERRC